MLPSSLKITGCLLTLAVIGCASASTVRETPDSTPLVTPPTAPAGVVVNAHVDTYPVEGDNINAIAASLRSGGIVTDGVRTAGFHRWKLSWNYNRRLASGQCFLNAVTVTVESTITLPSWTPPASARSNLSTYWNSYLAALTTHEVGHRTVTLAGASEVRKKLMALQATRCEEMPPMIQAETARLLARIQLDNAQYDTLTRKGVTQGAIWPPRVSSP